MAEEDQGENAIAGYGEVDPAIQHRFEKYWRSTQRGRSFTAALRANKDFRDSDVFNELVASFAINRMGTNYPDEKFDPTSIDPELFYDAILQRQAQEAASGAPKTLEFTREVSSFRLNDHERNLIPVFLFSVQSLSFISTSSAIDSDNRLPAGSKRTSQQ